MFQVFTSFDKVPFGPSSPVQSCSTAMLGHNIDVDHLLPEAKATSIYTRQHDFPLVPEEIKNNLKNSNFVITCTLSLNLAFWIWIYGNATWHL